MLVSASADNTVRTIIVPSSFGGSGKTKVIPSLMSVPTTAVLILLALMVLLLAILLRK